MKGGTLGKDHAKVALVAMGGGLEVRGCILSAASEELLEEYF
jgi:hypothetical protein